MKHHIHNGHDSSTLVLWRQGHYSKAMRHTPPMDSRTRKIVAENVKRLREAAGLTQAALGKRSGKSQRNISDVENPEGKSPTLATLEAIADGLKVPLWMLVVENTLDPSHMKALDGIVSYYTQIPASGQAQIERVAEAEARYVHIA